MEKQAPYLSPNQSNRIETEKHVIHLQPRISAAKLAEYVLADPSRQSTIAKQAKNAPKVITSLYHQVRNTFQHAHSPLGLDPSYFLNLAAQIEAAPTDTNWQVKDNEHSATALRHLAEVVSQIDCASASIIRCKLKPLMIHGVTVSVHPEIVFSTLHRGITKVGAVLLNTTQSEGSSLAKGTGKYCVADYLTTLMYLALANQLSEVGTPAHTKCHAIDVFRRQIHTAPASYKTLVKHMEEACKMIALRWDSIPVESDDELEAV